MIRSLAFVLCTLFFVMINLPAVAEEEGGQAYYDFGVFAYEDGDYEDAERNLKKALKFSPDNPFYNQYLGKTYMKMGRYQEAGNYLNRAWKADQNISGLKYDIAFLHYKRSDYEKAAGLFSEIVQEEPSNVLAGYHAGICYYKQEQYKKALNYFIIAAEGSPNIKANGYYYAGICHFKIREIKKAVEKLEYVKENAESESLKKYAQKWLDVIERQKLALKRYRLYLKMSCRYDDNVQLEPEYRDMYANEDDWVAVGYFSGRYDFVRNQDFTAGAGYSHYQTWHDDLGEYDIVASIGRIYGKYRLEPFTLGLTYRPHYYWLDSKRLLMRHQIRPEVTKRLSDNLVGRVSYSHYWNNHFQDNDRDGHTNAVFLNLYYSLGEKVGRLFGRIGYEDNNASHSDQCYGKLKTKLGLTLEIPGDFELTLTGRYFDKEYDNIDTFFNIKRDDSRYSGAVSLSHTLFYDWLRIIGEFKYTKNSSNIIDYEHKRTQTTLSLAARY